MSLGQRPSPLGLVRPRPGPLREAGSAGLDGPDGAFVGAGVLGVPGPARVLSSSPSTGTRQGSPLTRALARVASFASSTAPGAFTRIRRGDVAAGLRDRLRDPNHIDQGPSSLCGPSAFIRVIAFSDPLAYAAFVISLYETGRGQLGILRVNAGRDLREYDPSNQVNAADWIATASIRDSENWFFDYDETSDAFAGITLPSHVEKWFQKVGFRQVLNETNLLSSKTVESLREADRLFHDDFWVCLFVNSTMLSNDPAEAKGGSLTPNHWVALTSPITFTGDGHVSFTVFTWGDGQRSVPFRGALTVEQLLRNYYGYVAARR